MDRKDEFVTTCFIDKNYELSGKLYLDENRYIDFDEGNIYFEGKRIKVPNSYINLLFKLIKNAPNTVLYDDLFKTYYGYAGGKDDHQVLRNFKTKINKYINIIETVYGSGYKVNLPKRIKRFSDISRRDVQDIPYLFRDEIKIDSEFKYDISEMFEVSKKFLHKGASSLITEPVEKVLLEMENLSGLFNLVSEFENIDGDFQEYEQTGLVVVDMYNYITLGCRKGKSKEILKVEGPLGSYKNRIMQYIYLMIKKGDSDILPCYIDIAYYERLAETNEKITEEDFIKAFRADLKLFKEAIKNMPNKTPLLLLDGIRDFSRGKESLYYSIKNELKEVDCKFVACMDCDFTMNEQRKFKVHPLAPDSFMINVKIGSMSLYNKVGGINFIEKCIDIFDVVIPKHITAEGIYDSLVRLNFISIDAYWLVSILNKCIRDIVDKNSNISALYEAFCLSVVDDYTVLESACELAYEFEYGTVNFSESNVNFDMRWRLIRKHRSILDYLIAKQYIKKMAELDFKIDSREESKKKLSFFNMVLQKNITRFVITMLKGSDDYEYKIMVIANSFYQDLSLFGKSELTFWMGRLAKPKRKNECVRLLKEYNKEALYRYQNEEFENSDKKRDVAFLLRGINVSLMYENDEDAFVYYMNSLLTDKVSNSVNRGFHLEYYGDKPYIPNKSLLDFEDDLSKGENTLTVLCLSLDEKLRSDKAGSYVAVLEVMTMCNLIQARMEESDNPKTMNVAPYIEKCIRYLNWILRQNIVNKVPDVKNYFSWICDEFVKVLNYAKGGENNKVLYHLSAPYNKFGKAKEIVRTGWVNDGIKKPENIVEHMYNCWLIGMLYLPEEYSASGYNKNCILNMLLIHDLGETETGDISRPEKRQNQELYDLRERKVMQGLLFSGTYPGSANLSSYLNCWNDWDNKNGINYLIAKDIDNLQTTFQFCNYYLENPDLFGIEKVKYWLGGIDEMETEIGKKIMNTLVVTNPIYADIIKLKD